MGSLALSNYAGAQNRPFITTWKTTTSNETITIDTQGGEISDFDFTIDWGDGTVEELSGDKPDPAHTYATAGTYTVRITGIFPALYINANIDAPKLQTIEQWGDIHWESMEWAFRGAVNMVINAIDVPDLSGVTSMSHMFYGASAFTGDLSGWDVSSVTYMARMFSGATSFDGDLSGWDVSGVVNMEGMFSDAKAFNSNLSNWDVSGVLNMSRMFSGAGSFNGDVSGWDVSSVMYMERMFLGARSFNGDLSSWDVSGVRDMNWMFALATRFNGDLSGWDVSSVTDMSWMFASAAAFNGDLSGWDVSGGPNMQGMFASNGAFNGDLSGWDVSAVKNMGYMFSGARAFNRDLSSWDVSGVTDVRSMFSNSGLSISTYDAILQGWSRQTLNADLSLGANGLLYCEAVDARQSIIDNYNWSFSGDQQCTRIEGEVELVAPTHNVEDVFIRPELKWKMAEQANAYELTVSNSASFEDITFNHTGIEDTIFYVAQDLEMGTTYYWKVRMLSEPAGVSEWSEVRSFTTITENYIELVSLIYPDEGQDIELPARLEWSEEPLPFSYHFDLHISTQPDFSDTVRFDEALETNSAILTAADSMGTGTYYWRVRRQHIDYSYQVSAWVSGSFNVKDILPFYVSLQENSVLVHGPNYVNIGIHALDADGVGIPVLNKDSFILLENGNPISGYESNLQLSTYEYRFTRTDSKSLVIKTATMPDNSISIGGDGMEEVQENIVQDAQSYYWLNYMSASRSADTELTVRIKDNTNTGTDAEVRTSFDASDFYAAPRDIVVNGSAANPAGLEELTMAGDDTLEVAIETIFAFRLQPFTFGISDSAKLTIRPNPSRPFMYMFYANGSEGEQVEVVITDTVQSELGLQKTLVVHLTKRSTSTGNFVEAKDLPVEFALHQNYPNPFNPATNLSYSLPQASEVLLQVFDMGGRNVATLVNAKKAAGRYTISFDMSGYSSGMYICRIEAGDFIQARKLTLIK